MEISLQPSDSVRQLEAMALEFAQRNHQLETELGDIRKAEEEHLNEILRLRDVVKDMEKGAPAGSSPMLLPPGSATSLGEAAVQSGRPEAKSTLAEEHERLLAQVEEMKLQLVQLASENEQLLQQASAAQQELEMVKEQHERQLQGQAALQQAQVQADSAQGQPMWDEDSRLELTRVQGLLAREEEARFRAEDRVHQLEKEAEKSGANVSDHEHLAQISQLNQVLASQHEQITKQLAELNVTAQRANESEEKVEKMRQREQELTTRLAELQSAGPEKDPAADEAEQRAFQLETMLGNMKSIEGDYVLQVATLHGEKRDLMAQIAQLKQSETACEQHARRAMDLEALLAREVDARRKAEERLCKMEQGSPASVPKLAASEAAVLTARIAELESEVNGYTKRNAELNRVIQSVQVKEARVAHLERALVAPSSPPPMLGCNGHATSMSALAAPPSTFAAPPAVYGELAATDSVVNLNTTPAAPTASAQPAPMSVDAVAGRASAFSPRAPAAGAARVASPIRYFAMQDVQGSQPQRGGSPMRVIAVRQLSGKQNGSERQSAVSPIRVVSKREGPVRELRRDVSPRPFQHPGRRDLSPRSPMKSTKGPGGRGIGGMASGQEPLGKQPQMGYPLQAPQLAGGGSKVADLPPWIEGNAGVN